MRKPAILITLSTLLMTASVLPAGTIAGIVTYAGTPARPRTIDMSAEPSCAKEYAVPATTEAVVTGPKNALSNVVVYVSSGAPDEGHVPAQAITFEQKGCRFIPHVVVVQTGQELKIVNSDQTTHNVHPIARANHEWNRSQPPGARPITERYDQPEFIPVKCNVHPWMRAYFAVLKTSHYDLSKADGSFKLPDLPPGKYSITAWHEEYGTQTAEVTISSNEAKEVNFTFKAGSR